MFRASQLLIILIIISCVSQSRGNNTFPLITNHEFIAKVCRETVKISHSPFFHVVDLNENFPTTWLTQQLNENSIPTILIHHWNCLNEYVTSNHEKNILFLLSDCQEILDVILAYAADKEAGYTHVQRAQKKIHGCLLQYLYLIIGIKNTLSLQYSPVDDITDCALVLDLTARTSIYEYTSNILQHPLGYTPPPTCITYDAINQAYVDARKRIGFTEPVDEWQPPDIATVGEILLDVTAQLTRTYGLSQEDIEKGLPEIDTSKTLIREICPPIFSTVECRPGKYRRLDGLCNNEAHPTWGSTMAPYTRLIYPQFADGISDPRISITGNPLPSARIISRTIHPDEGFHDHAGTVMVVAWGQFMDHDFTLFGMPLDPRNKNEPEECCNRPPHLKHPYCLEIRVPEDDYFYQKYNIKCQDFVRSFPSPRPGCKLGSRVPFNTLTGIIDGNTVYGVTEEFGRNLRMGVGGLLRMNPVFNQFGLKDLLPPKINFPDEGCTRLNSTQYCFEAGEIRVNEQLVLTCMHTLMAREHNKIAKGLSEVNPHWDDETLYQESRRIVIAEIQHITYNEFLPIILGKEVMEKFNLLTEKEGYWDGYDPEINPNIIDAFSAAAFRFGHSLLPTAVERWSKAHKFIASKRLSDLIRRPYDLYRAGVMDEYLMGLMNQVAQAMDDSITQEVTNHLLKKPGNRFGLDLVAFNMQRGREFGIPGYMQFRKLCGLPDAESFEELLGTMSNSTVYRYQSVYEHPEDVDLWSGGVSERPLPGSMVGPTFACIIATQLNYIRRGDRFWYELPNQPSSFTLEQLQEIRKIKLSRIICDNTDLIDTIQIYPMVLPDHDINPRVPCRSAMIPKIDLSKWAEHPGGSPSISHFDFGTKDNPDSTKNGSHIISKIKMTACTNCGPEPPPIKIQNITLWDKDKNKGLENITNNLLNHETNQGTDTETDTEKIRDILGKTIFFSDIERLNSNESRPKRSLDNNQVSKQVDNTTPLVLPHFESRKIQLIPLEVDPSDSNHMTQAIMKENTNEGPPRLERVAQIVTNIVHSPRSLSYGRVQYPIYDSSITSTKQTSQPWGVTNKLIIRPTRYRSQYRFPPETNYYSNGGPYSSDYYQSPVSPPKYRKSKKLPAKLIDVYDHHDNQYEYIEMDINHEGKQVPKKPPKYMRSKYKNQNQGSSYGGYRDHYKKQTPSRPHKKGSSKSYYAQKDSYGYDNDNDRGGGFDYQEGPDSKRNPDYKDSNEEDDFNSQEDTYDRGSSETSGPKKSKFIPSQPAPGGGHYYRPPVEGSTPPRTPHKFIPVPKTLEEYHQLHGTKFLNSYKPDEDDEFTFHYPSDAHGNVDAQYDEEETSPPRFRPSHPTSNIRENKDTRLPSYNDGYKDTRPPSFDGGFKDTRLPSFDKGFKDTRSPSFDDGFKDDRLPSFDGFKDSTSPSYAPTYDGGDFNDPKTPTSFMSVAFGKPDLEGNAETRIRHTSPGRKLKYSQPLPSTQSEAYESNDSSGGDLSSKELQTFLDQVKTHVYDDHGNLKSDYKSDLKSDLKSSYFDASIDPYKNSHSGKKSKKGYNSNAKDLLENNHGNFNKKHNYRNRNSYSTSGNSKSNFNNGDSFSRKKHGWRGSGDGGFGYKETNDHDSFDGNLFDKGEGKPPGFKEDLFGKDRMKSLIPSESNNQQVTGRSNPGRHSRRVKIRVMKTNRVLEENETLVKPIVADDGAATTVETSSVVPTNVTIGNATAD